MVSLVRNIMCKHFALFDWMGICDVMCPKEHFRVGGGKEERRRLSPCLELELVMHWGLI